MCHGGNILLREGEIRVYNKRTRLIVESIHIKFDEIKEMTFEHSSSSLGRQCQMVSAENNTSGPVPQCSNDVCSHQFMPRSSSNDVCSHQFRPRSSSNDF
ncbi:hypothetical protein Tco_0500608 [Tanacetum coccineum]